MNAIYKFVLGMIGKRSGVVTTLPNQKQIEFQANMLAEKFMQNGIDPNALKSPEQVKNVLANIDQANTRVISADSAEGRGITEQLLGKKKADVMDMEGNKIPDGAKIMAGKEVKPIDKLQNYTKSEEEIVQDLVDQKFGKGYFDDVDGSKEAIKDAAIKARLDADNKKGIAGIKISLVDDSIAKIKSMEPIEAMKEANLVAGKKGRYANLDDNQVKKIMDDTQDHIFQDADPIEDLAIGGRVGLKGGSGFLKFLKKFKVKQSGDDVKEFLSKRQFMKDIVGNTEKAKKARELRMLKEAMEKARKNPDFKFKDVDVDKDIRPIFDQSKDRTLNSDGGRIGLSKGGGLLKLLNFFNKKSPLQVSKDYLKNVKEKTLRANETGKFMDLPLAEVGIPAASGALVNNQIRKKLKSMNEDQKEENLKRFIMELEKDEFYQKYPDLKDETIANYTEKLFGEKKANGGRIGLKGGGRDFEMSNSDKEFEAYKNYLMNEGMIQGDKQLRDQMEKHKKKLMEKRYGIAVADGGRIGLKGGSVDKMRRLFLQAIGAGTAGIAGAKSGLFSFGKGATKQVAKEVAQQTTSSMPPPYFFKLAEKIKKMGDDVTAKSATKDREVVTKFKEYELTEDVATGEMTIQRMKVLDDDSGSYYGKNLTEETYMNYKPGLADETTKGKIPPGEYEEGTALLRNDKEFAGEIVDESFKISDDVLEEAGEAKSIKYATGGRAGYQTGGDVSYDATDPIYGSSAATFTPNTVMDQFGNQVQAEMGNNFNKPLIPQVTDQAAKKEGIMNSSPLVSQAGGTGEIDMPIAGGINNAGGQLPVMPREEDIPIAGGNKNEMGILPVMPPVEGGPSNPDMKFTKQPVEGGGEVVGNYNDPLPQDQLMAGFAEWKRNNPDKVSMTGHMAMSYMTLPNGESIDFSGGAQAGNMARYLESIGQPPMTRRENSSPIKRIGDPNAKLEMALASGGLAYMLGE